MGEGVGGGGRSTQLFRTAAAHTAIAYGFVVGLENRVLLPASSLLMPLRLRFDASVVTPVFLGAIQRPDPVRPLNGR